MGHPWEQRKLRNISELITGGTPNTKRDDYWSPPEIPWMASGEINKKLINQPSRYISKLGFENSSSKWVPKNSVLIALAGQGKTRGMCAYTTIPITINQSLAAVVPNSLVNPKFLLYDLERRYEDLRAMSSGDVTRGGLNKALLADLTVNLPSLKEQTRIGEIFRDLEDLITLHQRKLDLLKEKKKGLLQKMFPKPGENKPELRFSGFTDPWKQRKISELFKITRGNVLAANKTEAFKSNEDPYPVYSSQTKNNGLMGYYKDYLYENAITWTTDGANAGTVNYRSGKFYCTNVCGVLLAKEIQPCLMVAERLNSVTKDYVSYVGNPKLMNNVMADININLPWQEEERQKMSDLFAMVDDLITLHQRKLDLLKEKKKGLLQKMFPKPGQQEPELRFSEFR